MLKLPTSLFECICFICVNIVSFSSLWGFLLAKVVYHCILLTKSGANKTWVQNVPEKSNEVCVSTLMYFSILLLPHYSLFYGLFFPEFYFRIYSTLRLPAEVRSTIWSWSSNPESLNCAFGLPYIKINSLCTHRTRAWSQKRASFICSSHTFGHVSGPLVSLAYT